MARSYFDTYTDYDPEVWTWGNPAAFKNCSIEDQNNWNDRYQKTRMRRTIERKHYVWNDDIKIKDFSSVEQDADQFKKRRVTIKDTFGIEWIGKKSIFNKWSWKVKNTEDNLKRYDETRKRNSYVESIYYDDMDKIPRNFTTFEKDAKKLNLSEYHYTDFFGIEWFGKKGSQVKIGSPDTKGSLYYYDDEYGEYLVSDYNSTDNLPPADTYARFNLGYPKFRKEWVDIANIKDIKYSYIVENHLFKDTHIEIIYNKKESYTFYSGNGYSQLVESLKAFGKKKLLDQLYSYVDIHFEELKNSSREEEREYYPGKTAEEYFNELSKIEED